MSTLYLYVILSALTLSREMCSVCVSALILSREMYPMSFRVGLFFAPLHPQYMEGHWIFED